MRVAIGKGCLVGRIGHPGNKHNIFKIDANAVPKTEKGTFSGELPSFQPLLIAAFQKPSSPRSSRPLSVLLSKHSSSGVVLLFNSVFVVKNFGWVGYLAVFIIPGATLYRNVITVLLKN